MSPLTDPDVNVLSETKAERDRRDHLLREANRHRYRLHRMRDLQDELKQATNELLKRELEARARPDTSPEPLGDAGAVGGNSQGRLPYKD